MSHPETLYNMNHLYLRGEPTQPARKPFGSADFFHPYHTQAWSGEYIVPEGGLPFSHVQFNFQNSADEYWRQCQHTISPSEPEHVLPSDLGLALGGAPPPALPACSRRRLPESPSYVTVPQRQYGLDTRANNLSSYPCYTIHFKQHGGDEIGILLTEAFKGGSTDLIGGDNPWYPDNDSDHDSIGTKISIRFHFESAGFVEYFRQVMSLRSTPKAPPISLKAMAKNVAKSTKTYLKGQEFIVDGNTYGFEDIYLAALQRVSHGSWQPVFHVQCR
ncbi:hypothetical protein GY45DRAFT_1332973 [Cubamyces sp. BRFM 1775]|nr:hypothetical protein GY45DRAFT_1332973 [Cubamyces sp. BRFM 1775]